jgi:sulfate adenylyltransferase large subunit
MATGASTCDLAIILIDARYGVQTQTKRHSFIASLLGIKHIIVAINKMDLVEYSEDTFNKIKTDYLQFVEHLNLHDIRFIPMSALDGDNVVNPSENMPWFTGDSLMTTLNTIEIASDRNFSNARFPVQYVNRPNLDFRGFCGTVASGLFNKGDAITVLPSGKTSTIKSIVTYDGELDTAFSPMAVTFTLDDEIDISRGDLIIGQQEESPIVSDKFKAHIVWMTENALQPAKQYTFKLASRSVSGSISLIHHRIDVNTLEHHDANVLQLNEIGLCAVSVNAPVVFDPYKQNKATGSFIIIDRLTNVTVGAGMITGIHDDENNQPVTIEERSARFSQTASAINLTGEKAVEIAYLLERKLFDNGHAVTVLELSDASLINAIKNAGLLALCVNAETNNIDASFDCDKQTLDDVYNALKLQNVIH